LLQKRLLSATCGSTSRALAGSLSGTGGTSTSPAPSRLRSVALPRPARPDARRDARLDREPVP
jgi:hypothetical protein